MVPGGYSLQKGTSELISTLITYFSEYPVTKNPCWHSPEMTSEKGTHFILSLFFKKMLLVWVSVTAGITNIQLEYTKEYVWIFAFD